MNAQAGRERVAIQGEPGSNSHLAALRMLGPDCVIVPCALAVEAMECLVRGEADRCVLPIENSLHGSVAEHYDLLLAHAVTIMGECRLRISHNLIAVPGVVLADVRHVSSHPVALSQCRRWLRAHPALEVMPGYDTAGSVKALMASGARDRAGIAPALAATLYGASVLETGLEDHAENFTRFLLLERTASAVAVEGADKLAIAFRLAHRPGTLLTALAAFQRAGMNLMRIESRPVPGRPWEYSFFVDACFHGHAAAQSLLEELAVSCEQVREMGRYCSVPISGLDSAAE